MPINTPILTTNTLDAWRIRLNEVVAFQTPTDLGTQTTFDIDVDAGCNKKVLLGASTNITVTFSGLIAGISGVVKITTPPSGTRPVTYTFPSAVVWENGVVPTPSYAYDSVDYLFYYIDTAGDSNGTSYIFCKYINSVA